MSSLRVLGIDPGYGRTGLGVVDVARGDAAYVWHTVIETQPESAFVDRLAAVRNDLTEAVRRFAPAVACVEALFFQTNVKTAMKVGMARGVAMLVLSDAGLPIVEVTPNQVKQGVAGWGSADKRQVQSMVARLLRLESAPPDDAADALALAIVGGLIFKNSISNGLRISNPRRNYE